jgi:hypothetical protein
MNEEPLFAPPARLMAAPKTGLERARGVKLTEADMLDLLTKRYGTGYHNGSTYVHRYAVARHVRSHAGFDALRTADFVAMDLWPSSGFALHGHEVKVSRSDWLHELKQPEKAQEFLPYMNFWWLVVSDASIVKEGELPEGWGLMAVRGDKLFAVRQAPERKPLPLTETRIAAFVRAVAKTAGAA